MCVVFFFSNVARLQMQVCRVIVLYFCYVFNVAVAEAYCICTYLFISTLQMNFVEAFCIRGYCFFSFFVMPQSEYLNEACISKY